MFFWKKYKYSKGGPNFFTWLYLSYSGTWKKNDLSYNPPDPSLICLSTSGAGASTREPRPVWHYMGQLHSILEPHRGRLWQLCHWGNKHGGSRRETEPHSVRRRVEPGPLRIESQYQLHGWLVRDASGLLPRAPVPWSHNRYPQLAALQLKLSITSFLLQSRFFFIV